MILTHAGSFKSGTDAPITSFLSSAAAEDIHDVAPVRATTVIVETARLRSLLPSPLITFPPKKRRILPLPGRPDLPTRLTTELSTLLLIIIKRNCTALSSLGVAQAIAHVFGSPLL